MKTLFSRAVVYGLIILFGLLCALPSVLPDSALEKLPVWYTKNQLTLGLDLRGGSHLLLEVDASELVRNKSPALHEKIVRDAVEQSLEVIRRRLDETGMVEPMITRQGTDSILVQLPGVNDPQHIRELLGTTARMTFHWVANETSTLRGNIILVQGDRVGELYQLEESVALEGKHISDARLGFNQESGEPVVNFRLDDEGAQRFGAMTKRNIGRALAIVLDGRVVTAPVIRSAIQGGSGEISGAFTSEGANDLALLLRAGALPAPLNVIEERTVGPDLGSDAISMGINTGILGALYLMRLPMQSAEDVANGVSVQQVKSAVLALSPDAEFPRVEMVGPRVSGDFGDATILAIILAGLGMLGYLWVRFESHFALAATITLALDVTKTIGFFALAGVEFNLTAVAALLALIGYSVNDKVVVFDRIRENLRSTPDKPLVQLLNESITSTLTRTVFTSVTTFLALLPMAIAGGNAVESFSLPMLFGIVIGTSSSILIAAPVVLLMGERRMRKGQAQLRPTAEMVKHEMEELP